MKHAQSGMTLIGFIVVLAVVGLFIYVGMKVIPMYTEYYGVRKTLKSMALEPGLNNASPDKLRALFFRRLYVNYSDSVEEKHLKVQRIEGGWNMHVSYEVRRPIIANLDVVGKFDTNQDIVHGGPAD
jgi:hypothetical protein